MTVTEIAHHRCADCGARIPSHRVFWQQRYSGGGPRMVGICIGCAQRAARGDGRLKAAFGGRNRGAGARP